MPALLWDVQAEHLGEAEYFFETWSMYVDSSAFTLADLAFGPEARLMAHVMGLVVAGQPVLGRMLLPVLREDLDDDRYRTAAAALAILDGAGREGPDMVLEHLPRARTEGRWGLIHAMHLTRRSDLAARLIESLPEHQGPALSGRLEALMGLGVDVGKKLRVWFKDDDLDARRAAAWLARHSTSSKVLKRLLKLMSDPDAKLRAAAIESALIRGLPGSWQLACQAAFGDASGQGAGSLRRRALGWVAMQGDLPAHHELIAMLRARPDPDLLWATGITGRPDAAELAVELLDDPKLGRLAGEVLTFIAGLPTRHEAYWLDEGAHGAYGADAAEALPPLAQDNLSANLIPVEELRLRLPRPDTVRAWWSGVRGELAPQLRYFGGQPLEPRVVEHALATATMRRRHAVALELAIRSAGIALIDTRAPARVQRNKTMEAFATLARLAAQGRGSVDFQGGLPLV